MIISEQKPLGELLGVLKEYRAVFLVGCGECATTCKTGGEAELAAIKAALEQSGKTVTGMCVPSAPCVAAKVKTAFAPQAAALKGSEAALVFACGLGVQSVRDNDRFGLAVFSGCNTLFGAVVDGQGNFYEKCSLCGDCVLSSTGGICPVTLCPKGLLNGPCGGMDKGMCEVDKEKDCAWVLIYHALAKNKKLNDLKQIQTARDYRKSGKPHRLRVTKP